MKVYSIVLSFLLLGCLAAHGQENTCITCHQELDPPLSTPVTEMKDDVHYHASVLCEQCHGGDPTSDDPEISMHPNNGFKGAPKVADIPGFCASCHSNPVYMRQFNPNLSTEQHDRYLTSQHGMLLAKGDLKVATCVNCHGVHNIKRIDDPTAWVYPTHIADQCRKCHSNQDYMQEYSISTSQYDDYKQSIHAKMLYDEGDLSAPTCNDCHGNHGAVPPGIASIANVCGNCHLMQQELFSSSPHKSAFDEMDFSECGECHDNHNIQKANDSMLGVQDNSLCLNCHEPDSKGYTTASTFGTEIDTLKSMILIADSLLSRAQQAGVEVKDQDLALVKARESLVHYRTLIHGFSTDKVRESYDTGMQAAEEALSIGQQALKEMGNRRKLLLIMVFLTLLVAILLILYVRQREKDLKTN